MEEREFQSTRPCGARPQHVARPHTDQDVSIHAPLRGATSELSAPRNTVMDVSIHAPLRGATGYGRAGRTNTNVSIHAPLRGATFRITNICMIWVEFQSTRPCGARQIEITVLVPTYQFQSTRPCGARRSLSVYASYHLRFNPRAPAGRDRLQVMQSVWRLCVSIHAPLRGATALSGEPPSRM